MLLFGLSVRLVICCHGIICSSHADGDCYWPLPVFLLRLAPPLLFPDIPRRYRTASVCSVAVSSFCRCATASAAATTGAATAAVAASILLLPTAAFCRWPVALLLLTIRTACAALHTADVAVAVIAALLWCECASHSHCCFCAIGMASSSCSCSCCCCTARHDLLLPTLALILRMLALRSSALTTAIARSHMCASA
jgi:hypothetical protein